MDALRTFFSHKKVTKMAILWECFCKELVDNAICLMNDLFSMISYPAVVQVKTEIQKTIISGLKISPGRNSVFSAINAPSQFGELGGLNISEIELSVKDGAGKILIL